MTEVTNRPKMDDWGRVKADHLGASEVLQLFDELSKGRSELINERHLILEAWKDDRLYGLRVEETVSMYDRKARDDPIFVPFSWYLLPCFCIINGQSFDMIWVHSRASGLGFDQKLLQELGISSSTKS